MIIVRLIGGLGNQLFQYAAARRLAHMRKVDLKLDTLDFDGYPLRTYHLNHFNIIEQFATAEEIARYKSVTLASRLRRRFLPYRLQKWVRERQFSFDPEILKLSNDVYLEGYWQSKSYFKDIEALLRAELTVNSPLRNGNQGTVGRIQNTNSVSIHVRRGDYVTDPSARQIHGLIPLDYYRAAVEEIASRIPDPHFFVFSDDPAWARDHLRYSYPLTFIDQNGVDQPHEDLRLMSLCQHHIIANSTFSWWGAWLSTNSSKIVLAPQHWFSAAERDTCDLMPSKWKRV